MWKTEVNIIRFIICNFVLCKLRIMAKNGYSQSARMEKSHRSGLSDRWDLIFTGKAAAWSIGGCTDDGSGPSASAVPDGCPAQ
jgi:hypothetical protein